jgi:hypothetical protein
MSIFKEESKKPLSEIENEITQYTKWLKNKNWEENAFAKLAKQHIYSKGLNYASFTARTGLNKGVYYGIINGTINPDIETVVSFCIGIGADLSTAEDIAKAAGYIFENNSTHQFYAYPFERLYGKSITEWNDYLIKLGKKPLTRLYKGAR